MPTLPSPLRPLGLHQALTVPDKRLDAVPLFDVLLIAIMFLLLGSRFVFAPGLTVELPTLRSQESAGVPTVDVLTVKGENFIIFQGTKHTLDGLAKILASPDSEIPPEAVLLLRADRSVDLETFLAIASLAREAGYSAVQIAARTPAPDSSPLLAQPPDPARFFP